MATSTKKKKVVSKDELRRLMKQTKATVKQPSKITHPHAKYNSLNQLVCALCNSVIKTDILWNVHIQSKSHKERVAASSLVGPAVPAGIKRSALSHDTGPESKKVKSQNGISSKTGLPADFFDKSGSKTTSNTPSASAVLADYGSSSEEESDEGEATPSRTSHPAKSGAVPPGLPGDFFGKSSKPPGDKEDEKPKTMADILPEGFFDDPKMDAKVRHVEYRDKMEEEWEQFQRAMKEETHVSEVIIEEDDEQANLERNIDEIDDQMNRWKEIDDLHDKKAEVIKNAGDGAAHNDSDEEMDEAELSELFDWRAKKTWK